MKPFLGIDLTLNKKNEQCNGEEFLVAKTSPALAQSFKSSVENTEEMIEKSKLPLPVRIIQWLCGTIGALIAIGIIKALGDSDGVSLNQAYQNASWLFWLAGVCLLVWGILKFISIQKQKNVLKTDESTFELTNLDSICNTIYSELSVPSDAKEIDILSFNYKVKNGDIKVCEKGMQIAPYINLIFRIFVDNKNLYVANLEGKYAFPLSSIKAIHTIKKNISIINWSKDEDYNKGIYKQYKLNMDNYGRVHCKRYYILEFNHNGKSWGIYIPCYELPVFEELTGLKA